MESWILLTLLGLLFVPMGIGLSRLAELFVIDVVDGVPQLRRGRLPPRLLRDIGDVVKRPPIARARVRVTMEGGRPMVRIARGEVPAGQLQQLRNVVGLFSAKQIREGQRR